MWGASLWSEGGTAHARIVKVDPRGGTSLSFHEDGVVFGEPVFVRRPEGEAEDDGVLLTVGSSTRHDRACLQVLDAATLAPLARASVDVPLPLGFHGSFLRA